MPRMDKALTRAATQAVALPDSEPNSFIASAARYDGGTKFKDFSRLAQTAQWHPEAWRMYHIIGEFRYSVDWVGNMLSKATIHATQVVEGEVKRLPFDHPASRIVEGLFGDPDGRAEAFRMFGIHFTVPGECILMGYPNPEPGENPDVWRILASTEVRNMGTPDAPVWMVHGEPLPEKINPKEVLVVRLWRPDPEKPWLSVSPAQAVLSTLGEIERLTDHVAAQIDSRLAGAGVWLLPSEISLPTPAREGEQVVHRANTADEVVALLRRVMAASIRNRGSAEAAVPIVITAPGDVIANAKYQTFWSELDGRVIELRNEAIRRLALGMDMPPEVLQGLSGSNHWNAWQADESAIKAHTEPLLHIITTALAEGILRPVLTDMVKNEELPLDTDVASFSIEADTSDMRLRPNRSKEALELYQMGILNREAVVRETGFEPSDLMNEDEYKTWLLQRVAGGSTTPELVALALSKFGAIPAPAAIETGEETQEARPQPSLREHPVRDIPDQERSVRRKRARENGDVPSAQSAALVAAADQIVVRAMERAGNRLKTELRIGKGGNVSAAGLYMAVDHGVDPEYLLDDAWAHVAPVAERNGMSTEALTASLNGYCTMLLEEKAPHTYEGLEKWLGLQEANDE